MNAVNKLPDSQRQLLEKVVYILQQTGGLDRYRLFKVLYFAERQYLSTHFRKLVEDDFFALKYGPVPTTLYDAIKDRDGATPLSHAIWEIIDCAEDEADNVLLPLRCADMDYIAQAEVDTLNSAISTYANKSFEELRTLSHGEAWSKTRHNKPIDSEDIAREGGIPEEAIPYLREQLEWQLIERAID